MQTEIHLTKEEVEMSCPNLVFWKQKKDYEFAKKNPFVSSKYYFISYEMSFLCVCEKFPRPQNS